MEVLRGRPSVSELRVPLVELLLSRVADLDAGTVAAPRAYRAARGLLALDLVRDAALVLSNLDGTHRHPERFSRRFAGQVVQARKALGEEELPVTRLHGLAARGVVQPADRRGRRPRTACVDPGAHAAVLLRDAGISR
jgi:hypothetical protein